MSSPSSSFSWKAFVSFYITFSFVVLGASGIVLYVAPPGRIANWSVWTLGALTKAQWQAVHTIFALIFLVAAAFHLYFNWKVLVAYVKTRLHAGIRMKRELAAAAVVGLGLLALTIGGVPPFSTVMAAGDDVKNAWSAPANEPPLPHAESFTVDKLAETVKIPADKARENLTARGVAIPGAAATLEEIAAANRLTPQEVYRRMQSTDAAPSATMGGGGWGRKTVEQVSQQYGVPIATAVARLAAAGFDAAASTSLKDLATSAGRSPLDIARIVVGPDGQIASAGHDPGTAR